MTRMPLPVAARLSPERLQALCSLVLRHRWPVRCQVIHHPAAHLDRPLPRPTLVPYLVVVLEGRAAIALPDGVEHLGAGEAAFFPSETLVDLAVDRGHLLRITFDEDLVLAGEVDARDGTPRLWTRQLAGGSTPVEAALCERLAAGGTAAATWGEALVAAVAERAQAAAAPRTATPHRWAAVEAYLRRTCHLPIDRARVAAAVGIHPNHLSRLFARHAGVGFLALRTRYRLEAAARRLRRGTGSAATIARDCGFTSLSHFHQAFRRQYGCTPTAYRSAVEPG